MSRVSYLASDAAKRVAPFLKSAASENPVLIPSAIDRGHIAVVPLQKTVPTKKDYLLLNSSNLVFCRSCCLSATSSKSGKKLGHVVFHAAGYQAEKEDVVNFSKDFWQNSGVEGEVLYDVEAVYSGPLSYRDSQATISCDEDMMEIVRNLGADPIEYIKRQEECSRASDELSREVFGFSKHNYYKLTNGIGLDFKVASFVFDRRSGDFVGSFALSSGAHENFVKRAKSLKNDGDIVSEEDVALDEKEEQPVLVYSSFVAKHPNVEMIEGARYYNPDYHKDDIAQAASLGEVVRVVKSFPKLFTPEPSKSGVFLRDKPNKLIDFSNVTTR